MPEPENLLKDGNVLKWDTVENATGYIVKTNNEESQLIQTNSYDISNLNPGDYTASVKAIGDGELFKDSEYCESIEFTVELPDIPLVEGQYSLCIDSDNFTKVVSSGSGYTPYNGTRVIEVTSKDTEKTGKVLVTSENVMIQTSKIQFRKDKVTPGVLTIDSDLGNIISVYAYKSDDEFVKLDSESEPVLILDEKLVIRGDSSNTYQFSKIVINFEIGDYTTYRWVNGSETLDEVRQLSSWPAPEYDGETPTKPSTAQYSYEFSGWTESTVGDVTTYTAQFTESTRSYAVKFMNGSETLQNTNVAYGTVPEYIGATPTKPSTAQYDYTFAGWSTDGETVLATLPAVTGEATYIAVFTATERDLTVIFDHSANYSHVGEATASYGEEYEATISANAGYVLPSFISVTMGGQTLVDNDDYTWNSKKGSLWIMEVTGNVVVSFADVKEQRTVTLDLADGSDPQVVSVDLGGTFVLADHVPAEREGFNFLGWIDENGNKVISDFVVTENRTLTATWSVKDITQASVTTEANFKCDASGNIISTSLRMYLTMDAEAYNAYLADGYKFAVKVSLGEVSVEFTNFMVRENGDGTVTIDVALNTTGWETDEYDIALVGHKENAKDITTAEASDISWNDAAWDLYLNAQQKQMSQEAYEALERYLFK